ncbi:hypothetical protein [Clostridium sp. HMP27]|uniref:hypothetical protein n=1 Tax=Clostridium sp. HMP27 TaxID=1487921 RepID=UPI00052D7CEC|nr:hypothetical protein [Clostridium sp. HMP27]KGK84826.1 hypothetical protein DP68_16315 [Clostridium sp. HMP27]
MNKKAKKILLNAYWSNGGWKNGIISEDDHAYAIKQGAMFQPNQFSHDETIENIKQLCTDINLVQVTSAFLSSLSTRNLEYRSALGSYIYGNSIVKHDYTDKTYCNICGFNELKYNGYERTWDIYNFERFKWGGLRHTHSSYAMFDLFEFNKLPKLIPTKEDIDIFKNLIKSAQDMQWGGPRDLEKSILSLLPSNKAEREVLLGILGICGILETSENKGFLYDFKPIYHRDPPSVGRANDWEYPVSWWKASDRVNEDALYRVFGNYLC